MEIHPSLRGWASGKVLPFEEERELLRRYQTMGCPRALDTLLSAHWRLGYKLIRPYLGLADEQDIVSVAVEGMIRAAKKFDLAQDVRFATYARWWVMNYVVDYVNANIGAVSFHRSPHRQLVGKLVRARDRLMAKNPGMSQDAADEYLIDVYDVAPQALDLVRMMRNTPVALDAPTGEDKDRTWSDSLADENAPGEDELVDRLDLSRQGHALRQAMSVLNERERNIIERRALSHTPATLEELAQLYGVSRERIRQIENEALGKIKKRVKGIYLNPATLEEYRAKKSR